MKKLCFLALFLGLTLPSFCQKNSDRYVFIKDHPDEFKMMGKDRKEYFLIFASNDIYIVDDESIFKEIATHLPATALAGRSVRLAGPRVSLKAIFYKSDLKKTGKGILKKKAYLVKTHALYFR